MTNHNPILAIFQLAPNDGSIQAGGPTYKCMVEGCDRPVIINGRDVPEHAEPRPVLTDR